MSQKVVDRGDAAEGGVQPHGIVVPHGVGHQAAGVVKAERGARFWTSGAGVDLLIFPETCSPDPCRSEFEGFRLDGLPSVSAEQIRSRFPTENRKQCPAPEGKDSLDVRAHKKAVRQGIERHSVLDAIATDGAALARLEGVFVTP